MDNERLNMRVNQIEEQLSNTLKAIDKFHADMEVFKNYAVENNKVVNGILRKLDDQSEKMDKMLLKISDEQKQRRLEIQQEQKLRRLEMKQEQKERQLEMQKEQKERQLEMSNEQKQRKKELDEQNRRFYEALEQDKTLRLKEIAAMNKRLEWLENKA